MPLINGIIPQQNYELIGNRIVEVLAVELDNQATLANVPPWVKNVWNERFITFDETDCPLINVVLSSGNYDNKDQTITDGKYKYWIVCHVAEKTKGSEMGDKLSTLKLHRILGMCRAILENPIYSHLQFPFPTKDIPGVNIVNTHVGAINIPKITDRDESGYVTMGYLEYYVKVPEGVILIDPIPLASSTTEVKLYLTDKGYRWGPDDGELDFLIAEDSTDDTPIYLIAEQAA